MYLRKPRFRSAISDEYTHTYVYYSIGFRRRVFFYSKQSNFLFKTRVENKEIFGLY